MSRKTNAKQDAAGATVARTVGKVWAARLCAVALAGVTAAGLALSVAQTGTAGIDGRAAALPDLSLGQQKDPCRTREPTLLDRLPEWRCVGLARFHQPDRKVDDQTITDAEVRRLRLGRPRDDFGVAVSPDGRLYRQVSPLPARGVGEARAGNPGGGEDPEGEPGQESRGPFWIVGNDDRTVRLNTTSYPWRALVAILPPGDVTSTCSGVLVGPRHVLTAGHCIHTSGAWLPNRKIAPGMKGVNTFPNALKHHSWYYSVTGWVDSADKNYDYAMIILEYKASTANLGWFGWKTTGHTGTAWNFGYPGWFFPCAGSPTPPLCSNYLYGANGSIPTTNWGLLEVSTDAQNGQSGSPIYKYNGGDRRVIAVLSGQSTDSELAENWGTRIRSAVSDNLCTWISYWPSGSASHDCY